MSTDRMAIEGEIVREIVRVRERLDAIHGQLAELGVGRADDTRVLAWLAEARGQQAVLADLARTRHELVRGVVSRRLV